MKLSARLERWKRMDNEYCDLLICVHPDSREHKNFLFQTVWYSGIQPDDEVIVETKYGKQRALVVQVLQAVRKNSPEFGFIVKATNASLPLKRVLKTVTYRDIDYGEEK